MKALHGLVDPPRRMRASLRLTRNFVNLWKLRRARRKQPARPETAMAVKQQVPASVQPTNATAPVPPSAAQIATVGTEQAAESWSGTAPCQARREQQRPSGTVPRKIGSREAPQRSLSGENLAR
jgi:hypothetical protein